MRRIAKPALEILLLCAALLALEPYFGFLVSPPAGQEIRWAITVIALGVLGFAALLLRQLRREGHE